MSEVRTILSSDAGTAGNGAAGKFLRFLGWFFLVALIVWVIATALGLVGRPPLPRLFGVGTQHASEFTYSANVQKQLEEAQTRMDAANQSYNTIRWLADITTWASFLATAAITLITGGFNLPRPKRTEEGTADQSTTSSKPQPMRFHSLGFIAAVASVCTLLGTQLGTKASANLACAKEIRDRITEVAQAVKDTPQNEVVLLTRLRDATGRDCL